MNPLVSICCITFNQEQYVEKTLQGFLAQKTTFPVEILIHDDASTDNTPQIIKKYEELDDRIFVIYQTENKYSKGEKPFTRYLFPKAKGKYLAICEGDDYWTDSLKLQKQIDFLEVNPDFSASFHDVDMLYNRGKISYFKTNFNFIDQDKTVDLGEFLQRKYHIPTCSLVFRKDKIDLPPFIERMSYGDFILFACILINSKAHVINDQLGVYRANNPGSVTNNKGLFDAIRIKADYIEFLTWLMRRAKKEEDRTAIEQRIYQEVDTIRTKVKMYKNSKFFSFYANLRNKIKKLA